MAKLRIIFFFSLLLFYATLAFAHGEDKQGPHGGIIRMPSTFHTEIVPVDATHFKVFLLDIYFRDPITKNSKVTGSVDVGTDSIPIRCEPKDTFFECSLENKGEGARGNLKLLATRDGMVGTAMQYTMPLRAYDHKSKEPDSSAGTSQEPLEIP